MRIRNYNWTSQNPHLLPSRENIPGFHLSGEQTFADTLASLDCPEKAPSHMWWRALCFKEAFLPLSPSHMSQCSLSTGFSYRCQFSHTASIPGAQWPNVNFLLPLKPRFSLTVHISSWSPCIHLNPSWSSELRWSLTLSLTPLVRNFAMNVLEHYTTSSTPQIDCQSPREIGVLTYNLISLFQHVVLSPCMLCNSVPIFIKIPKITLVFPEHISTP